MNFVTIDQLNRSVYQNISKIPKDIDLIVGIPRSGMLVANLIALYMNLPFTDMESFLDGRMYKTGKTRKYARWIENVSQAKKVLIVDDSISKGDAMKEAKEKLEGVYQDKEYVFCAAYALPTNTSNVDVYFEICNHPRMFEWNYLHHWGLNYACVDFEGILCENGVPKILPTQKIKCIVSTQPKDKRYELEKWLADQGVQYDELVLVAPNEKGSFYKKCDAVMYIATTFEDARELCEIANKQVFCQETRQLLSPDSVAAMAKIKVKDNFITAKRVYKKLTGKL